LEIGRGLFNSRDSDGDVVFEVGTPEESQRFSAHALVLQHRSDVWKAQLREGGFQESVARRIRIEDVSAEVFLTFLEMLYTADLKLPKNGGLERGVEVALLADRYGVAGFGETGEAAIAQKIEWGKNVSVMLRRMFRLPRNSEYRAVLGAAIWSKLPRFTASCQDITSEECSGHLKRLDDELNALQDMPDAQGIVLRLKMLRACQEVWTRSMKESTTLAAHMPNAFGYLLRVSVYIRKLSTELENFLETGWST